MDLAVYGTIWLALALFVAGELGKRGWRNDRPAASWAWPVSAAGAAIAVVHIVLAMSAVGWSHQATVMSTARRTESVYGVNWGGGVVLNYVFVAAWIVELFAWRRSPARFLARSTVIRWTLRVFYLVMIANAAIVFAGPTRRSLGVALVAALVFSWWPARRR
jgi:hypothetical protein